MYIRRLQGQKSGLEDSYLKLEERDLLEDSRHVGYIGIIDQLTISDENRLTQEVQTLRVEKSRIDRIEERLKEFNDVFSSLMK